MVIFFGDYIRVREDSSTPPTLDPLNSAPWFLLKVVLNVCKNETMCNKMIRSEIEDLNNLSINRRAADMLCEVGEEPDKKSLFCVQLALWAIEKAGVTVESSVEETIRAMLTWRPVRLTNFLMMPEADECLTSDNWEGFQTPEELASMILEIMERRMLVHFPWYFNCE